MTPRFAIIFVYNGYVLAVVPFARENRGRLYDGLVIDGEHLFVGMIATVLWLLSVCPGTTHDVAVSTAPSIVTTAKSHSVQTHLVFSPR